MKQKLIFIFTIILLITLVPFTASAATHNVGDGKTLNLTTGELTETSGGALISTYTLADGDTLSVAPGATATITGSKNVMISCGNGVALTIDNVTINLSGITNGCALSFTGLGNTLNLVGDSVLTSGTTEPGIRAEDAAVLTIDSESDGSMTANGGAYSAGIGGGIGSAGGDINIIGGTVTANGGLSGAGIGGGYNSAGGDINIIGGTVTANGGLSGAGIGGGSNVNGNVNGSVGGDIDITGGTVTAKGGDKGAGIGGGAYATGGDIDITGGTVTANGGKWAAGIGSGYRREGGDIDITSGTVTAHGGECGAGIGGGYYGAGGNINITGGIVKAGGGLYGAGIGGGYYGAGGDIDISGGEVYADGDIAAGANDIGNGGSSVNSGTLEICGDAAVFTRQDPVSHSLTPTTSYHVLHSDESINETSPFGSAYGFAHVPDDWSGTAYAYLTTTLLIDDTYINAVGTAVTDVDALTHTIDKININTAQEITIKDSIKTARRIQIEGLCSDVKLTIEDLSIDVSGLINDCALSFTGIGNTLNLVGHSVLSSGGMDGGSWGGQPGIKVEPGTALTIDSTVSGTVEANGGYGGAGIGGGYMISGGEIIIAGGIVQAAGGTHAAGIGGGYYSAGGNIEITGGTVTAKGGSGSAGIGGGDYGYGGGGNINIKGGTVEAIGGDYGAGIGGGVKGPGGNIHITGGQVYADGDTEHEAKDIGYGYERWGGTLAISGDAVVFTRDNPLSHSLWATADCHTLFSSETIDETSPYGSAYGFAHVPDAWSGIAYAYIQTTLIIDDTYISKMGTVTDVDTLTQHIAKINIDTTQAITIKDSNTAARNIQIEGLCSDVKLTIEDLELDVSSITNGCALAFTGTGSTLDFVGDCVLTSWGQITVGGEPGIRAETGSELTIGSASGGTVTANGGCNAAGIGGGGNDEGGDINITSGTVTANGGYYAAGIGGGYAASVGKISITGGTVIAKGRFFGAGIGGGGFAAGGDIRITGGKVYADGDGLTGAMDIGGGKSASGGSLEISGSAAVFLKNDSCIAPTTGTHTHTHKVITSVTDNKVYGIGANGWTPGFGVYMRLCTLDYSTNGGSGTVPQSVTQHFGTETTVGDNSSLSRATYILGDWNTQADAKGTEYQTGDTFLLNEDITLFAHWHEIPVTSLTLTDSETVVHHETLALTAQVLPSNATHPQVSWESSDTDVATVDASGKVTAVGLGNATVTAVAEGKSDTCIVTIKKKPVTSVTLSSNDETMTHRDTFTLSAQVSPSNATYPQVSWKSSNTNVATVDDTGKVTAVGVGNSVITATADGQTGKCDITVNKKAVSSVTLSSNIETMTHHDTLTLSAQALPSNATYPTISWKSSNTDIATVDDTGKVTAAGVGNAVITATVDGQTGKCDITVTKKSVASVTLSKTSETMTVDDTMMLKAQVLPSNATYPKVSWKSSNTNVATVDASGKVIAKGTGSATITAMADEVVGTCTLTVKAKYVAPTKTPEPSATKTPEPSATKVPEHLEDTTPKPTETANTEPGVAPIPVTVIETDENTADIVVEIVVADLPEDTEAIQTPNGEILYINDSDTVEITLHADEINADGMVELIMLSEEQTPLGVQKIYVPQADECIVDVENENYGSVLIWVLTCLGCAVVIGIVVFILKREDK